MTTIQPQFIEVDGDLIALRHRPGEGPGVVWLGGFRSDMLGTKAEAIDEWAARSGRAFVRHDYSGHGESGGAFVDGTISRWLKQSLAVFRRFTTGPQILVGSSMGGWIALRMAQELRKAGEADRIGALALLAPAPDFSSELVEPKILPAQREDLAKKGYFEVRSKYGPDSYVYTRALIEDGRRNRVLDGAIETGFPVHILQGMEDPDVPWSHAMKLLDRLPGENVRITLVKDGDHRLSRPQDIALLLATLDGMVGQG